jgi:hypothetical protein
LLNKSPEALPTDFKKKSNMKTANGRSPPHTAPQQSAQTAPPLQKAPFGQLLNLLKTFKN